MLRGKIENRHSSSVSRNSSLSAIATSRSSRKSNNRTTKSRVSSKSSKSKEITSTSKSQSQGVTPKSNKSEQSSQEKCKKFEQETAKLIYKGIDDNLHNQRFLRKDGCGLAFLIVMQLLFTVFTIIAFILSSLSHKSKERKVVHLQQTFYEAIAVVATGFVVDRKRLDIRSLVLGIHFMCFFVSMSEVLRHFDEELALLNGIVDSITSSLTVNIVGVFVHVLAIFFVMDIMGTTPLSNNYENEIIIESVEKRKEKIYLMIVDLFKTIFFAETDQKVGLVIIDENGKPVKLDGSTMKSDLQQVIRLRLNPQSVEISSINTTGTSLSVENVADSSAATQSSAPTETAPVRFIDRQNPTFNSCTQQVEMLSPQRILTK